mmetsp:Transcript_5860/g.17506  ORF Transcript_5860/g.17506 Transcript_5860/m.17506 type:complete len:253 (+) Transcript_5860:98-856(+)
MAGCGHPDEGRPLPGRLGHGVPAPLRRPGQPRRGSCNTRRLQFAQGARPAAPERHRHGRHKCARGLRVAVHPGHVAGDGRAHGPHRGPQRDRGRRALRLALDDDGHPLPHPRGLPAGPGDLRRDGRGGVAPHRDHRDEGAAVLGDAARRAAHVRAPLRELARRALRRAGPHEPDAVPGLAALRRRPREEGHGRDGPALGPRRPRLGHVAAPPVLHGRREQPRGAPAAGRRPRRGRGALRGVEAPGLRPHDPQ